MRLLGKVAVVTGAASGIGKEIARAYRCEGAKVVIADLNQAGADTTAAELGGEDAIGVATGSSGVLQVPPQVIVGTPAHNPSVAQGVVLAVAAGALAGLVVSYATAYRGPGRRRAR